LATFLGARSKEICVIGKSGTILQTQVLGNVETLSENIQNYIKDKYKGFKVKEYYAVKDFIEKRNIYKVVINNKKTGIEEILWFTTGGLIIE
jgi:predicted SPOUT superfamily RNA methylase MTH1